MVCGLSVKPELLGRSHVFPFSGQNVIIELPGLDRVSDHPDSHARPIRAPDGTVLEYDIHRVNVIADLGLATLIDPESLERPPVAYGLYVESEKQAFEALCERHRECSESAFEYWLSILRWKLDDFRVGHSVHLKHESGWSTYLHDLESNHPAWIKKTVFVVEGRKVVEANEWLAIEAHLQSEQQPPIYASIKYDAQESLFHRDYRKAFTELAMACEIFMRQMVLRSLPEDLPAN